MNKKTTTIKSALVIFSALFLISFVSAVEINFNSSSSSLIQIQSLKYEPYPVNPGEYFEIWISAESLGTQSRGAKTISFELNSEYPFSLNPNETGVIDFGSVYSLNTVLHYKLKVDEDAVAGVNELELITWVNGIKYAKTFEIEVANSQTNFDAVVQDVSDSEVSIAIANTGKVTANSVIVKIPTQDNFVATGTDGQMVGNLESGDYSIVSFEISKKMSFQENLGDKDKTKEPQAKNLSFEIYYTDNIGERRVVTMELPVTLSTSTLATGEMPAGFGRKNSGISIWYIIAGIIVVLGIGLFIIAKKAPKLFEKIKSPFQKIFKKISHKKVTPPIPEWIKNSLEKEKK